jgi:hemolysin activation/secretion protein
MRIPCPVLAAAGIFMLALAAEGAEFRVGDCVVTGTHSLPDQRIAEIVGPVVAAGTYPTSCIQAAQALEEALRREGAFAARVFPETDRDRNVLVLRVAEGRLAGDGLELGRSSARVRDDVILGHLAEALPSGEVLTARRAERAILLLNDLPGIKGSENTLYPAEREGEARFETFPEDSALVEGSVFADNFGSRVTGDYRAGALVDVNSPLRLGDKLSVQASATAEGTYYLSLDASMPVASNGARAGLLLDLLDYRTGEPRNPRGTAHEIQAHLSYPFVRSRRTSVFGEARAGREDMRDQDDVSTITDRYVESAQMVLRGSHLDDVLGGATSDLRFEGTMGYLDLGGHEPYRREDALSARTAGDFARLAWTVSRLQHLSGPWQGYLEIAGQIASRRLDSSQSIGFGGPYDFAGYHGGEILGDEGHRLHVDLRYNAPSPIWEGQAQVSAFYAVGTITTHAKEFVGNAIVPGIDDRRYELQSVGLALSWSVSSVTLRGVVGKSIANEIPNELLDGSPGNVRGWFQLVRTF